MRSNPKLSSQQLPNFVEYILAIHTNCIETTSGTGSLPAQLKLVLRYQFNEIFCNDGSLISAMLPARCHVSMFMSKLGLSACLSCKTRFPESVYGEVRAVRQALLLHQAVSCIQCSSGVTFATAAVCCKLINT